MVKRVVLAGLMALMLPFGAATAKPPLREVPEIVDTLFIVAVANEVAKICPTITPRRLKGLSILLNLRAHANKLGYSDDEIRAQIESKEEKAWMRAKGEAYLKSRGVVIGEPETYCVFGREEIRNSSAIGALLKAR